MHYPFRQLYNRHKIYLHPMIKKAVFCLLLIILSFNTYAQDRDQNITITGTVLDENQEPMIGFYIFEKQSSILGLRSGTTTNGTMSNLDGDFSLTLSPGKSHTVAISFIGYRTMEVEVKESETWTIICSDYDFRVERVVSNAGPQSTIPVLSHEVESEMNGPGVLYMTDDMPSSYHNEPISKIKDIRSSGKGFSIQQAHSEYHTKLNINYTSVLELSSIGHLPKYQSTYAQGHERFTTELYSDDKITETYSPKDFFGNEVSFMNSLNAKFNGLRSGYTDIGFMQRKDNSPIPNAYKESYNFSLAMKDMQVSRYLKSDIGALYNTSYGRLTEQGSNMSTLMHSILTTPPTFDNLNGFSAKDKRAWTNPDGTYRSYSSSVDNPYALVNELRDRNKNDYLMTYIKTLYKYNRKSWANNLSFDKLWDKRNNGTLPYTNNQRLSKRTNQTANITYNSDFEWIVKDDETSLTLLAQYGFNHTEDKLFQSNKFQNQSDLQTTYRKGLIRNSHDIKYGIKMNRSSRIFIEAENKHYFSNTAHSGDYLNLFPEAGILLKLDRILEDLFDWDSHSLSFYSNIKRSIGEASLIDRNPAILSTIYEAKDFRNYYEYQFPVFTNSLKPETYIKSEIGFRYHSRNGYFSAELNGYNYSTHNVVSPVLESSSPALHNIGRLRSYGYFLELNYHYNYSYRTNINIKYHFSQGKSKATAIYGNQPFYRLGGFRDISTVFAKNEPLGAIYGTTYQRNEDGQIIIGTDGSPLINSQITKIGDPNPDFVMSLNPNISYKRLDLSFILEYRHGGDRWNGTKAFMDYQGMSENKTLGVGEDYIEKANTLRLSNINLTYTFAPYRKTLERFSIGFSAKNLFLISSYDGVDPATSLFGYSSTKGLDLFNLPSMRSYSFILSLTF